MDPSPARGHPAFAGPQPPIAGGPSCLALPGCGNRFRPSDPDCSAQGHHRPNEHNSPLSFVLILVIGAELRCRVRGLHVIIHLTVEMALRSHHPVAGGTGTRTAEVWSSPLLTRAHTLIHSIRVTSRPALPPHELPSSSYERQPISVRSDTFHSCFMFYAFVLRRPWMLFLPPLNSEETEAQRVIRHIGWQLSELPSSHHVKATLVILQVSQARKRWNKGLAQEPPDPTPTPERLRGGAKAPLESALGELGTQHLWGACLSTHDTGAALTPEGGGAPETSVIGREPDASDLGEVDAQQGRWVGRAVVGAKMSHAWQQKAPPSP